MNTLCTVLCGGQREQLKEFVKIVITRLKTNKQWVDDGRVDPMQEMLVDYGLHCSNTPIKLDYNKYNPDRRYSGGFMLNGNYYSYYRYETPKIVWEWVVDFYFDLAKWRVDERLPDGFKAIVCNFIKVPGYESYYKQEEKLNWFLKRCVDVQRNNAVEKNTDVADCDV